MADRLWRGPTVFRWIHLRIYKKPFSEVSNPSKLSSITCHTLSFVIWSVCLKHTAIKFCFRKMRLVMFAKAEKMKTKSRIWKEKFSILSPSFELFKTWLYLVLLVTRPLFSSKSKFFKLNFDWIETLMRDKIFRISVENRGRSRNRPAWNGQSSIWKR